MNAVASPISTNTTTTPSNRKIRRKNDIKANLPQSQINKCNNEKRRRELENNYIEQLSEFLQLNKRGGGIMSTKPDKAAILSQVVKTYRDICDKNQNRDVTSSNALALATSSTAKSTNSTTTANTTKSLNTNVLSNQITTTTRCRICAKDNCSTHPVQQGEVSSSESTLAETSLLNGLEPEITAYFEALEYYISSVGWVLLQVNADGIIESCTQNISDLIGYEKQELYRKSLYIYLYPEDHAKLHPVLRNMSNSLTDSTLADAELPISINSGSVSLNVNSAWTTDSMVDDYNSSSYQLSSTGFKQRRSISTKVRMLVKDTQAGSQTPGLYHNDEALNQKSMREYAPEGKYKDVVLIAAPVKDDDEAVSSVLCLITRPEDDCPLEMNIQQHVPYQPVEQMTFKLDVHGKIISLDVTTLREPYKQQMGQWTGRLLQDMCHVQDLPTLKAHLRDVQESVTINAINANSQVAGSPNPPILNVVSKPFRLRLGSPDVFVHVKANSRLFLNQTPGESDFIMSVQTLLNLENDMNSNNTSLTVGSNSSNNSGMITPLSQHSCVLSPLVSNVSMDSLANNNSLMNSPGNHYFGGLVGGGGMSKNSKQLTNVGGPLMTSAVIDGNPSSTDGAANAQRSSSSNNVNIGVNTAGNSTLVNSFTASPSSNDGPSFYSSDFEFDLQPTSFEIDPTVSVWNDSRPNSRNSVTTPVSTPRPSSRNHGFSPAVCPSPSTPYQLSSHSAASLPSPQSNTSQSAGASYSFSFPTFDASNDKIDKDYLNNNNNNNNNNNINHNNSNNGGNCKTDNNNSNAMNVNSLAPVEANSSMLMSPMLSNNNNNIGSMNINLAKKENDAGGRQTSPPTESERLRHLLTNKSYPLSSTQMNNSADGDNKDNILQLYKQRLLSNDEGGDGLLVGEENGNAIFRAFKMTGAGYNGSTGLGLMRSFSTGSTSSQAKNPNSHNPMLLSLLKCEDDDNGSKSLVNLPRPNDVLSVKDDSHNTNSMSPEELRRMLKIQNDAPVSRKRPLNDGDNGISAKRTDDRPSKLCENNKMLASLLKNPPKNITINTPPVVKTIPDIAPATLGRMASTLSNTSGTLSSSSITNSVTVKSATVTTQANGSTASERKRNAKQKQQQQHQHQLNDSYASGQQQMAGLEAPNQLQRVPPTSMQQKTQLIDFPTSSSTSAATSNDHAFPSTPRSTTVSFLTTTSTTSIASGDKGNAGQSPNTTLTPSGGSLDIELSKILDSVMEYVTDDQTLASSSSTGGLTKQQINERMAINAIQNSLMVETSAFDKNSSAPHASNPHQKQQHHQQQHDAPHPPAYPRNSTISQLSNQHQQHLQQQQQQHQQMQKMLRLQMLDNMRGNNEQNFHRPPPNYPARGRTVPINAVATPSGAVIPASSQQRYRSMTQQQLVAQQKERLLQQQQKQHLLVPENATARSDHLCMNTGMNDISTLLNTVAPNVTLSRANLPPESQLSPNFVQTIQQQQQQQRSPGPRKVNFNLPNNNGYGVQFSQQNVQRLSPQQQQQLLQSGNVQQQQQQHQMSMQSGGGGGGNQAQLSSSQAHFNIGNNGNVGSGVVGSSGLPASSSNQQWTNSGMNAVRGHSLQQHNPMLSAQLQSAGPYNTARQYQHHHRGCGLNSPIGALSSISGNLSSSNSFQTSENAYASSASNSSSSAAAAAAAALSPFSTNNIYQHPHPQQRQNNISQHLQHLNPCNTGNSSEFVKQELRAVVSGRAAAAANSSNSGGAGAGNAGNLRASTPLSPLGATSMQTQQQQQQLVNNNNGNLMNGPGSGAGCGGLLECNGNSLLSNSPDPTIGFSFDTQDFFGSSTAR